MHVPEARHRQSYTKHEHHEAADVTDSIPFLPMHSYCKILIKPRSWYVARYDGTSGKRREFKPAVASQGTHQLLAAPFLTMNLA